MLFLSGFPTIVLLAIIWATQQIIVILLMLAFINPQQPTGKAQYTSARDKSKQPKFANVIVTNNQPKGPNPFNLA